jgi:hypothetical protein
LLVSKRAVAHHVEELLEALVVRELLELDSGRKGVGIGVVRNQVPSAELRRIHAELVRGEIDDALR